MTNELKEKLAILKKHKKLLAKEYHVKTIGIFGSYVRGEQTPESDIDVVVELSEPIGLFKFVALQEDLSDLLKVKVDLGMKNAIKPRVKNSILQSVVYA